MRHDDSGICEDCGMQFGDPNMTEATKERAASLPFTGESYTILEASRWRVAREALAQGVEFVEFTPGHRYAVDGVEGLIGLEEFEELLGLTRMIEVGACD